MNLPPQAYTRETLMLAFDWIRSQPKQIQELASTSDALVSIYMQARRRGGQFIPTNPVSAQSFKQDLKNLAEGLKQFDGADGQPSQTYQTPQTQQPPQPTMPLPPAQPTYYAGATPATFESDMALDAKSIDAARQVQQRFNLSSENEAIRLLIALGAEKFREMAGK